MSALLKASRNDAIIARCLQTISQLIPLTSAVFYRVNNRLKPENYILHNISDNTHQQYLENFGNDSNLLIVFYVQIMPDDFVMQLHRF